MGVTFPLDAFQPLERLPSQAASFPRVSTLPCNMQEPSAPQSHAGSWPLVRNGGDSHGRPEGQGGGETAALPAMASSAAVAYTRRPPKTNISPRRRGRRPRPLRFQTKCSLPRQDRTEARTANGAPETGPPVFPDDTEKVGPSHQPQRWRRGMQEPGVAPPFVTADGVRRQRRRTRQLNPRKETEREIEELR